MTMLAIVGLRRSGSTIFWETLRQDPRLRCYDEPFHPKLLETLPGDNNKQTWQEFASLPRRSLAMHFSPITPDLELTARLSPAQLRYLAWLSESHSHVVFDTVRATFKARDLFANIPSLKVVHLYRAPNAWVSSHLLPTPNTTSRRGRLANAARRVTFWTRRQWFDNYHYETICREVARAPQAWTTLGLEAVANLSGSRTPAVVKLMTLWRLSFTAVESAAAEISSGDFLSVPFERFCDHPQETLESIYGLLGISVPTTLDLTRIKPANLGHMPDCLQRWHKVADAAQVPRQLLATPQSPR